MGSNLMWLVKLMAAGGVITGGSMALVEAPQALTSSVTKSLPSTHTADSTIKSLNTALGTLSQQEQSLGLAITAANNQLTTAISAVNTKVTTADQSITQEESQLNSEKASLQGEASQLQSEASQLASAKAAAAAPVTHTTTGASTSQGSDD